jgi:hypothetical protein
MSCEAAPDRMLSLLHLHTAHRYLRSIHSYHHLRHQTVTKGSVRIYGVHSVVISVIKESHIDIFSSHHICPRLVDGTPYCKFLFTIADAQEPSTEH